MVQISYMKQFGVEDWTERLADDFNTFFQELPSKELNAMSNEELAERFEEYEREDQYRREESRKDGKNIH